MSELLPCPFCGGEAETWDGAGPWHAICKECGAIGSPCLSEAEAIAAWNNRAERTCEPIIEQWDDPTKYDAYCGNCNYPLGDGELEPWNYCPNCGCKVVS